MNTKNKTIGIVLVATNAYFVLGVRFIKKFMHYYCGDKHIIFHFFSDRSPHDYLQYHNVKHYHLSNNHWIDGANAKFKSILSIDYSHCDYVYFFDADTNINDSFTDDWFVGTLVGGQHFADQLWMKHEKEFDRNPQSKAYIPIDTHLPQMYFYGAFFGGETNQMMQLCETLYTYQLEDKKLPYEPRWNDESYLNREFHYNPPSKIIKSDEFKFLVSDKGSIENMRDANLDITSLLNDLKKFKHTTIDIIDSKVVGLV